MNENLAGKNILVTGGTGFLGSHLVRVFESENIKTTVLTRNAKADSGYSYRETVNFVELDLLNTNSTTKFVELFRPDIIVHLAGSTSQTQINYEATVNLLNAARSVGVEKFVLLGTADEYGFQNCPQNERMTAAPVSEYAVSKNKAVNYALSLFEAKNFPIVILRPFTIYGIRQPSKMFVSQAVVSAVEGTAFEMSAGRQKRDALFVTDLVNAIIKTLTTKGVEGEIFNVGSGQAIRLRDLALKIWRIAGADENLLKIGARRANQSELHDTEADVSKIRKLLNWEPQVSLDEGLKIIIEAVKTSNNER